MTSVFSWFIQGSFVTAIFLLFYRLLLRRDTFFKWSRWYFLLAITASFLLPLIDISGFFYQHQQQQTLITFIPDLSFAYQATTEKNFWQSFINNLLLAGILMMLSRLFLQFRALWQLRKNRVIHQQHNFRIVELKEHINPFSFFNEIYINPSIHSEKELEEIIRHEQFHIQQKHTIDILTGELLTIVFWFNPFAWLLKNALKQNLEFLTDRLVLQTGIDAKHYQYNLLKVSGLQNNIAAANHFHFLKLKNRIIMMNKKQSHPYRLAKYLLLVPVVAIMLMAFSNRKQMMQVISNPENVADTTSPADKKTDAIEAKDSPEQVDKQLPDDVKALEVTKKNGINKVIITLKNGQKETYDLNKAEEKKAFEKKYGSITAPPPPPTPEIPDNVKAIYIDKDNNQKGTVITIELKNGKKEKYDLNNPEEKKAYQKKYGTAEVPVTPAVPPVPLVPVERKQISINEKGFYLSIADDNGECVVIVKDKDKKIKEAIRLTEWNDNKFRYESAYGKIPEIKDNEINVTNTVNVVSVNSASSPNPELSLSTDGNIKNTLLLVDGKETSWSQFEAAYKAEQIKSMSILKGTNATSKYGDKGKNGVVEIALK